MKHICSTVRVYQDELDQQHYQRSFCFCWEDVVGLEDTTEIWERKYAHVTKVNINDGDVYHVLESFVAMAAKWEAYLQGMQEYVPVRFSGN